MGKPEMTDLPESCVDVPLPVCKRLGRKAEPDRVGCLYVGGKLVAGFYDTSVYGVEAVRF